MLCSLHDHYITIPGNERGYEIDATRIRFGRGLLDETGDAARALGMTRVGFFVDPLVKRLPFAQTVRDALYAAGLHVMEYDEIGIEPTDATFAAAVEFARDAKLDGYVSLGGGSTIDTAKAANLYATYPAEFMAYVNAPIGEGRAVPGPLKPHIACPTTSGTGSECTGIAIFDLVAMQAKTGIVSRRLKPTLGIIDPDVTASLPAMVVASSGFDVLSHAVESFTARPYTQRERPSSGETRPLSQGANPFSDSQCLEALRVLGNHLERGVHDASDAEARGQLMFAATLAGIGFGSSGCHAPHGMSYSVSGLVREFRPPGYPPNEAIVPHGMSVILNAPAVFRFTASAARERHLAAAAALGADVRDAALEDAGEILAQRIIALMRATNMPNGLAGVGYRSEDAPALTAGAFPQKRLFSNAPREIDRAELQQLYQNALTYW